MTLPYTNDVFRSSTPFAIHDVSVSSLMYLSSLVLFPMLNTLVKNYEYKLNVLKLNIYYIYSSSLTPNTDVGTLAEERNAVNSFTLHPGTSLG